MIRSVNTALVLAAVVLGGFLIAAALGWNPFTLLMMKDQSTHELRVVGASGDFDAIIKKSQENLLRSNSSIDYETSRMYEAYGFFMKGGLENRTKAIEIVRETYKNAGSPESKAAVLNQLVQFLGVDKSKELFDLVFTAEPFSEFYVKDSFAKSLANIAAESYRQQHSVVALGYSLFPHTAALSAANAEKNLSSEDRAKHVEAITSALPALEEAYQEEMRRFRDADPLKKVIPFRYYYWRGLLLSIVSRSDASRFEEAKKAYEDVFAYYETTKNADGTYPATLELRLWESDIGYTLLLLRKGGDENKELAHNRIRSLIQRIEANPKLHEAGYVQQLRLIAKSEKAPQGTAVKNVTLIAKAFPEFGAFVSKYGVTL
ncbi:hypothetical protein EBR66_04890 [bacterium]|nr:hypothetical protein [bacterium]